MAESFVDTLKTELIADRVWKTAAQVELAIVEWVGWFNHAASTASSTTSHPSSTSRRTAPWPATGQPKLAPAGSRFARPPGSLRSIPPPQPLPCSQPKPSDTVSVEPGPAQNPVRRSSRLWALLRLPAAIGGCSSWPIATIV